MAILKIARMGHPVLLQRAQPVADPAALEVSRLIADMIETMDDAGGAGLAAPQVHVSRRLFVFRVTAARAGTEPDDAAMPAGAVINPVVTPIGDDVRLGWEGCLSIPGLQAEVPRHWRIRYSGVDERGQAFERDATGFHARVVQHEIDHLEGIMYPMRMTDFSRFGFNEELARAREQLA